MKINIPKTVKRLPYLIVLFIIAIILFVTLLAIIIRMDVTVTVDGYTSPLNYTIVRSEKTGIIKEYYVQSGQFIDKGTLLVQLYDDYELEAIKKWEANYNVSKSELDRLNAELAFLNKSYDNLMEKAKNDFHFSNLKFEKLVNGLNPKEIELYKTKVQSAKTDLKNIEQLLERNKKLYDEKAIPYKQLENIELQYGKYLNDYNQKIKEFELYKSEYTTVDIDLAKAEIEKTKLNINSAQISKESIFIKEKEIEKSYQEVKSAEVNLVLANQEYKKTKIYADISGKILTEDLETLKGKSVQPGSDILIIGSLDTICVKVQIPENYFSQVKVGQPAKIFIYAYPYTDYKVFDGEVIEVSPLFKFDQLMLTETNEDLQEQGRMPYRNFNIGKVIINDPYIVNDGDTIKVTPGMTAKVDIVKENTNIFKFVIDKLKKGKRFLSNLNIHL